jgi:hypothetical protein
MCGFYEVLCAFVNDKLSAYKSTVRKDAPLFRNRKMEAVFDRRKVGRSVRPWLFQDDGFVQMPLEARLGLLGLFSIANREGRVEWNPILIKKALFPGDCVDLTPVRAAWERFGFVRMDGAFVCIQGWQQYATKENVDDSAEEQSEPLPAPPPKEESALCGPSDPETLFFEAE